MRRLLLVILLLISARGLAAQEGTRAALLRADAALSDALLAHGPNGVLVAVLGADGVLVWPGAAVVQGTPTATSFFAHQPLMATARLSWQPFRVEISPDSTLAIIVGVAVFDRAATDPVPAIHRIGRYLAAWARASGQWHLTALSLVNLIAPGETIWTPVIGPRELPMLRAVGPAARFIAADSAFAADAGINGTQHAFTTWAAPDGMTFAFGGEFNMGPQRIGAVFAGNTAHWEWGPVAAGASSDGTLGWTVGQATITPTGGGVPVKSKYLTLWRRMPDGTIRFIADGGNARP